MKPVVMIAGDFWLQKRFVQVDDTSGTTFGRSTLGGNFEFYGGSVQLEFLLHSTREHWRYFSPQNFTDAETFASYNPNVPDVPYIIYGPSEFTIAPARTYPLAIIKGKSVLSYYNDHPEQLPVERFIIRKVNYSQNNDRKVWRIKEEQKLAIQSEQAATQPQSPSPYPNDRLKVLLLDIEGFGAASENSGRDYLNKLGLGPETKIPVLITKFRNRSGLFLRKMDSVTMKYRCFPKGVLPNKFENQREGLLQIYNTVKTLSDLAKEENTRSILILQVDDLRMHDETVSYQIGWERTRDTITRAVEALLTTKDWEVKPDDSNWEKASASDPLSFVKYYNEIVVSLLPDAVLRYKITGDKSPEPRRIIECVTECYIPGQFEGDTKEMYEGLTKVEEASLTTSIAHYEAMHEAVKDNTTYVHPEDLNNARTDSAQDAKLEIKAQRFSTEWTRTYADPDANLVQAIVLGMKAARVAHLAGFQKLIDLEKLAEEQPAQRITQLIARRCFDHKPEPPSDDRVRKKAHAHILKKGLGNLPEIEELLEGIPLDPDSSATKVALDIIEDKSKIGDFQNPLKSFGVDIDQYKLILPKLIKDYSSFLRREPSSWVAEYYYYLHTVAGTQNPRHGYYDAGIDNRVDCMSIPVHFVASTIGCGNVAPYRWYGAKASSKQQEELRKSHKEAGEVWTDAGWVMSVTNKFAFARETKLARAARFDSLSVKGPIANAALKLASRLFGEEQNMRSRGTSLIEEDFHFAFEECIRRLAIQLYAPKSGWSERECQANLNLLQDLMAVHLAQMYLNYGDDYFLDKKFLFTRQQNALAFAQRCHKAMGWGVLADRQITDQFLDDWLAPFPCLMINKRAYWDKTEIEMMREIYSLVKNFVSKENFQFLNIVLLGKPGSGKSSNVEAIISDLNLREDKLKKLDFNLSQFSDEQELIAAFEKITEVGVSKIPVVLWDEFDSNLKEKYGWVEKFLRAMQDGVYSTRYGDRRLPRSIFFFAGSRIHDVKELLNLCKKVGPGVGSPEWHWQAVKGQDFKSRLSYPFVTGNIDLELTPVRASRDIYSVLLRRAGALRFNFKKYHSEFFDENKELKIDTPVSIALLLADYYDDLRSIDNVIKSASTDGRASFDASCLPTNRMLELHCDPKWIADVAISFADLRNQTVGRDASLILAIRDKMQNRWVSSGATSP